MEHFHLIPLFAGIINAVLGVLVVYINPRRRLNRVFLVLSVSVALWNFGAFSLAHVATAADALVRARWTMAGVILLPATFYDFACEITGGEARKWRIRGAYLGALLFELANLTPAFVTSVRPLPFGWFSVGGPAFLAFYGLYFPACNFGMLTALIRFVRSVPAYASRSAKLLLAVVVLLDLTGIHDMLPVLGFDYYPGTSISIIPWGTLMAGFFGLVIGYNVLNDQFLDVRVSLSRGSATLLRLGFFSSIAYLLMVATGLVYPATFSTIEFTTSFAILVVSASITAYLFPKLFGELANRWEDRIAGDRFEYEERIQSWLQHGPRSDTIEALLHEAADIVVAEFRVKACAIGILRTQEAIDRVTVRSADAPIGWDALLVKDSPMFNVLSSDDPVLDRRDTLRPAADARGAHATMVAHGIDVAVAIGVSSRSPVGLILLGGRANGRRSSRRDRELLQAIAREVALAVERIALRHTDELREANNAKDRFLAAINHEIRNPLNGISGIAHMLSEQNSDPKVRYLLQTLSACAEQLRSTMDDVLDFTRIAAGEIAVVETTVELREVVKTTCASFDLSAETVRLGPMPADAITVRCDAGKIRQVLSNYLSNALKYGVPSGATVAVTTSGDESDSVEVVFKVTSTGPTLPIEEINTLFNPLTRGRRARETNAHGTGLGLAHCRKLAEAMGGQVGVESADGTTCFWLKLSLLRATPAPKIDPAKYSGKRVLAVEDEPYNRLVLGHYLEQLGFAIIWAATGNAAIEVATQHAFDLVVMDWFLPDMTGRDLLVRLRELWRSEMPPTVVVSAFSTTAKKAECLAAGATAFVSKPVDIEKLSDAFERCAFAVADKQPAVPPNNFPAIDVSRIVALGPRDTVLRSFLANLNSERALLQKTYRSDPPSAANHAHRLRSQMGIIRADEAAGLLDVLQRALSERWPDEAISRLIQSIDSELGQVAAAIGAQNEHTGVSAGAGTTEAIQAPN